MIYSIRLAGLKTQNKLWRIKFFLISYTVLYEQIDRGMAHNGHQRDQTGGRRSPHARANAKAIAKNFSAISTSFAKCRRADEWDRADTRSPQTRGLLPWSDFLPVDQTHANLGPRQLTRTNTKTTDLKELLDEGKKRLAKAENEGALRECAAAVASTGSEALSDVLADLREPSFSCQQNE